MGPFIAVYYDHHDEPLSTSTIARNPLPQAEQEALDSADLVEMNCRRQVYRIEMMHDGEFCSELHYRF